MQTFSTMFRSVYRLFLQIYITMIVETDSGALCERFFVEILKKTEILNNVLFGSFSLSHIQTSKLFFYVMRVGHLAQLLLFTINENSYWRTTLYCIQPVAAQAYVIF